LVEFNHNCVNLFRIISHLDKHFPNKTDYRLLLIALGYQRFNCGFFV
jgi:hypothetical protein